jgi:thioredoxin reductase (NADPH)
MERAVSVDLDIRPYTIKTDENEFETETIIIASGASARLLGLESEKQLIGRGVSTCATCDGYFFRGQKVVVVGGGDTAMEDSLFLTKHAEKVTIVHRRDELRASKIMAEKALNNPKIDFIWDTVVTDVLDVEKGGVEAVKLKNVKTGEENLFETNGLFVAIGHDPNTDIFKGKLDMDENGYLIVDSHSRTNIEGVFAAGDVHDHVYRQAITAAGAGCKAAIECERYLQEKGIE